MVCFENAKMVSAEELKEILQDDGMGNATVEGLMFVETRETENQPGKVFPCYPVAFKEEEEEEGHTTFMVYIVQFVQGAFQTLEVFLHEEEMGIKYRIWDKPPTKGLREYHPFVEAKEQ